MKNKTIYVMIIFSLFLLLANLVQASPMPWGIALNHETKECAGYWAGDEFTYYELPYGWKAYYPDYKSYNETTDLIIVETNIGNFNITKSEFPFGNWYIKFCNETNYSYISQNIGLKTNTPEKPTITGPLSGKQNISYSFTMVSTDADNDSIQYIINWGDKEITTTDFIPNGTSTVKNHFWSSAGKYIIYIKANDNKTISGETEFIILIDAYIVNNICYLLDHNSDGIYDTLYNEALNGKTRVEKRADESYLLDMNGDSKWDHSFNPATSILTSYTPQTPGFELVFVLCAIGIALFLWRKKRRV